jgi:lambda repressor-like predicted transcriptional regulator
MTSETAGLPADTIQSSLTLSAVGEVRLGSGRSPKVPFWSLVDQSGGPETCWPWTGPRDPGGYGRGAFGWTRNAHRNAYRLIHPDFDVNLDVCHHCDNPPCCNPRHLFAGTHQENLQDAGRKGRLGKARGERHPQSKLDWAKVAEIHRLRATGLSERALGERFGVSQVAIHFVLTGTTWSKREERVTDSEAVA